MNAIARTPDQIMVRPLRQDDYAAWKPLWDGYNAFYGRYGDTALPEEITQVTWRRFHDPDEPMFALVAECGGRLLGFTHYLFHRSTTQIEHTCYLRDLFIAETDRGRGIGRALVEGVYREANAAGAKGVYWQTNVSNVVGRRLYDQLAINEGFIVYSHE